jgi:hemerythrin-like domain-containing protein
MDPFEILKKEHQVILKNISELDEMTYSVSVNVRDLSFLFKEVLRYLEQHEKKEELLFEALSEGGYIISIDQVKFEHGDLKEKKDTIMRALNSGDEEEIKDVLYSTCAELIDLIKAHILAEESALEKVPWDKLDKKTIEKIELLQIVPSRKLL